MTLLSTLPILTLTARSPSNSDCITALRRHVVTTVHDQESERFEVGKEGSSTRSAQKQDFDTSGILERPVAREVEPRE